MMAEPMFPERRTRSQLTLPDNILQIPQRSPLKDAKTAFRNQGPPTTPPALTKSAEETDDELLLSPDKNGVEIRKASTSSKRSASPDLEDGYRAASGSPSEGREVKRVKRDTAPENGHSDAENVRVAQLIKQHPTPGHTRNHSEPKVGGGRRSARKRSATTSKKPLSTVSDSPPFTAFSPGISPKKGRAQSVPLFPTIHDIPRIDFRNPPPSPRRANSPSRSPAKEKLRITSGPFLPKSTSLPTIPDASTMDTSEETSSVAEEIELPLVSVPPMNIQPSSTTRVEETVSVAQMPSASTIPVANIVPATPVTQSLNKLIPMSPLTPVPETPFPAFGKVLPDTQSRMTSDMGWGKNIFADSMNPPPIPGASTTITMANSRLPRPSLGPFLVPPKTSRPPSVGPPEVPIATTSKAPLPHPAPIAKKGDNGTKKDAFVVMMKKPLEARARLDKEKGKAPARSGFHTSKAAFSSVLSASKEKVAGPLRKAKEKMRPREKPKAEKAPLLLPLPDEDDESFSIGPFGERSFVDEEKMSRMLPEPLSTEPVLSETAEDTAMASPDEMHVIAPPELQVVVDHDTTMNDTTDEENKMDDEIPPPSSSPAPVTTTPTPAAVDVPAWLEESQTPVTEASGPTPPDNTASEDQDRVEPAAEDSKQAPSKPGPSKLPMGKKRQPTSVAPANRVTRSVSKQKDKVSNKPQPKPAAAAGRKKPTPSNAPAITPLKRTASGSVKKPSPKGDAHIATDPIEEPEAVPPGSPMRLSSPGKAASKSPVTAQESVRSINYGAGRLALATTPTKSKASMKPASSPSPSKIARATSLFIKPSAPSFSRTFSLDFNQPSTAPGSSLSTLSNALEKLRMPPPSRPNTSMGFNRDTPGEDDISGQVRTMDDVTVGRASMGLGLPGGGVKRAATLGASAFKAPTSNATASSSKAGSSGKNFVQKPLSMFMSGKGANSAAAVRGAGRTGPFGNRARIFGVGGPPRKMVSKKTTLPVVIGSPVKGGDSTMREYKDDMEEEEDAAQVGNDSGVFMAPANASSSALSLDDLEGEGSGKGKEKMGSKTSHISRRVSMVSHALSQSLSESFAPAPPSTRGLMGPPPTPPSAASSGGSPSQAGTSNGTRSSSRIAKAAATSSLTKPKDASSSNRKAEPAPPPNPAAEALKVLSDCIIFVDVKTDDGDEAGSLFVEMLEGVGARVLTRVGTTCTHIVYKNGLMSTLTRYRLLRDPKPLVVGIGWVVECVEQRKHVDETNFLVDLDGVNVAGTNKRRRSMFPKLFADVPDFAPDAESNDDGDLSIDGSNSSMTMDDDLAPLERARRRKSMMTGIRP